MVLEDEKIKQDFEKQLEDLKKEVKRTNILVLGKTGVGKSSLINTLFGEDIAKVSHTKPETRGFHKYVSPNIPINIIDSEGYELETSDSFCESIDTFIDSNFIKVQEQVHVAWYCISISGARVLPYDLDCINHILSKNIPVAVIFTQADNDTPEGDTAKALSKIITDKFGSKVPTFQISNVKKLNDEELDATKIIEWSSDNISDENVRAAFVMSQKASLKVKFKSAQKIILAASTAAAAIGASPIPGSDAPLLIATQTAMTAKIFNIYGLNVGTTSIMKNLLSTTFISLLGKSAVGNLLKFIPGFGTAIGAAINATVASTFTASIGYAMCKFAELIIVKQLEGTISNETLVSILSKENLEKYIKEYAAQKKS